MEVGSDQVHARHKTWYPGISYVVITTPVVQYICDWEHSAPHKHMHDSHRPELSVLHSISQTYHVIPSPYFAFYLDGVRFSVFCFLTPYVLLAGPNFDPPLPRVASAALALAACRR